MPQLHHIVWLLGAAREHKRLIAVWVGAFSALATAMVVGAFATGGGTLDAGSATPPHPLDTSHPCTWYVPPVVSDASRTMLEVGVTTPAQQPSPNSQQSVANRGAQQSVNEGVERSVDGAYQATQSERETLANAVTPSRGSGQQTQQQRPLLPMFPSVIPDPIVNAPSPARQGTY